MFGKLKSGTVLTSVPPLSSYMTRVLEIFLQRPTIALLLHRISHVAQCVCILTKALPLFILLLNIAYVELMVGEMKACTCVTYIAKSNNGSMEMTNHTSWSRSCTYVEGGWCKWNTPFMNLSLLYLDNMRTWLYIYIFSWTLMCPFFSLFFLNSPCLIWRILERERSLNMEFYFVDGWNGIANFKCRSLAVGVHVILIKQAWKTSH